MMLEDKEPVYFDGTTSIGKKVAISIHQEQRELELRFVSESNVLWSVDDLQCERYGPTLEIRNKRFEGALLRIQTKELADELYAFLVEERRIDIHTRLRQGGMLKLSLFLLFILTSLVLGYFYVLPPIAEQAALLLPESVDNSIGNSAEEGILSSYKIDTNKTKAITAFMNALQWKNVKPIKLSVVNSEEVNAFALPNGRVVVFTGLLDKLNSPEELAALLGHEISHVNERHSIRALSRNLAGYLVISVLFSDVNGVVAIIAENAHMLNSLSYSRDLEQEADEKGLQILMDNQLDPNGAVKLFEQLEKEESEKVPTLIRTHPLSKDRKARMQEIIAETPHQIVSNEALNQHFRTLKRK